MSFTETIPLRGQLPRCSTLARAQKDPRLLGLMLCCSCLEILQHV